MMLRTNSYLIKSKIYGRILWTAVFQQIMLWVCVIHHNACNCKINCNLRENVLLPFGFRCPRVPLRIRVTLQMSLLITLQFCAPPQFHFCTKHSESPILYQPRQPFPQYGQPFPDASIPTFCQLLNSCLIQFISAHFPRQNRFLT